MVKGKKAKPKTATVSSYSVVLFLRMVMESVWLDRYEDTESHQEGEIEYFPHLQIVLYSVEHVKDATNNIYCR